MSNRTPKLFVSEYIENFFDTVSVPNKSGFDEMVGLNQLGESITNFSETLKSFFLPLPSFEEFLSNVRDSV